MREQISQYVQEQYGVDPLAKFPDRYPNYQTFCHPLNGKWFAMIMDVPRPCIGLSGDEPIDIINLKADPLLIDSLVLEEGYHRAWHMNKTHWISVRLDGSVALERVLALIDMSYGLVSPKKEKDIPFVKTGSVQLGATM